MLQLPCAVVRSLRSPLRAGDTLSSPSFPLGGALALFAWRQSGLVAAMLTRYTNSLRSSAGFPCAQLRQHSVAVGASGQESVASRCATAAAAFITTHSFNGWRCCPIPTFAKTSLGNSFASSLHSHVASMLRRLIGLTFIAHRMMARNWRCLVDDKRFPVSAPWVRRGTRSISPMPAAAALLQSFVRAVLTWRNRSVTSNCKQPDDTSSAVLPLIA